MFHIIEGHRGTVMTLHTETHQEELSRLRNRHVGKLLTFLGKDLAPCIERAIKQQFTLFESDVLVNIVNSDHRENTGVTQHDNPHDIDGNC
jgi:hypothetical protein